MDDVLLGHCDCVRLLRSPERVRCGIVAIDGGAPVPLACVLLDSGDVLIPTGPDSSLVQMAALHPVSVEFTDRDRLGRVRWTVHGVGLARRMTGADVPRPVRRTPVLAMVPDVFGSGVRVVVARYHGCRPAADVEIPSPRGGDPG